MTILNLVLNFANIISSNLQSILLSILMLVSTVGAILLLAYLINRHITKKEQEEKDMADKK